MRASTTPALTGRTPTSIEPMFHIRAAAGVGRFAVPLPVVGELGWPPSEPCPYAPGPSLGTRAAPCYRPAGRVPDDAPVSARSLLP